METHQTRLDRTSEPAGASPAAAGGFAAETAALPAGFGGWTLTRAGIRASFVAGREQRGLIWNTFLPGGAQLLGSEVEFDLALCAVLHTG